MSGTNPAPAPPVAPTQRGTIVISIVAQVTFLAAFAGVGAMAYFKVDGALPVLLTLAGVAGTNATTIVNFWCGSSSESARKTELLNRQGLTRE